MWKKKIAVLMAAAMITGMSGMTVFAEEETQVTQQVQQAPQGEASEGQPPQVGQQAPTGVPQGEAPQMEQQASQMGEQAPEGQPPQMGEQAPTGAPQGEAPQMEQKAPQGEVPQAPEGEAPTEQTPQGEASQNGQQPPQMEGLFEEGQSFQNSTPMGSGNRQAPGEMGSRGPLFIDFESCVKDGTISQETYDAIKKYMDENKPEKPSPAEVEGTNTEKKDGEKPEEGEKPDLLKDLLDAEVITQDEYDALAKKGTEEKIEQNVGAEEEKTEQTDKTT